ncbi:hypothetical protein ACFE04_011219 [Oxalis oulophora]
MGSGKMWRYWYHLGTKKKGGVEMASSSKKGHDFDVVPVLEVATTLSARVGPLQARRDDRRICLLMALLMRRAVLRISSNVMLWQRLTRGEGRCVDADTFRNQSAS